MSQDTRMSLAQQKSDEEKMKLNTQLKLLEEQKQKLLLDHQSLKKQTEDIEKLESFVSTPKVAFDTGDDIDSSDVHTNNELSVDTNTKASKQESLDVNQTDRSVYIIYTFVKRNPQFNMAVVV